MCYALHLVACMIISLHPKFCSLVLRQIWYHGNALGRLSYILNSVVWYCVRNGYESSSSTGRVTGVVERIVMEPREAEKVCFHKK